MNIADKMHMKNRLRNNLANWITEHGTVLSDRHQSNEYVGIQILEVLWQNQTWTILIVDGMVCRIEKDTSIAP